MVNLKTYFETLGEAKDEARKLVPTGYILNEDDYFTLQHLSYGTTGSIHARMTTPKGVDAKRCLHAIIYRMESGRYELTAYLG